MNDLFSLLEVPAWKPALAALLLPPVPLLLGVLLGARQLARRGRFGWLIVLASVAGIWSSSCTAAADALGRVLALQPPPLSAQRLQAIADRLHNAPEPTGRTAIVVLGGGREAWAPEYRAASLSGESLERLRHGLWLARATGAPVAFSGGTGWSQANGEAEADIAARIAAEEFRLPLRWVENRSRDTLGNARQSVALLRADGIDHVLLVTHGWHMRRALRAFEAQAAAADMDIEAAPIGLARADSPGILDWLPSTQGARRFRELCREQLGWWFGA